MVIIRHFLAVLCSVFWSGGSGPSDGCSFLQFHILALKKNNKNKKRF